MLILGIIGSKGKTSTANTIASLLQLNKVKTNVVGTLGKSILTPSQLDEYTKTLNKSGTEVLILPITHAGILQGFYKGIPLDIIVHTSIDKDYYGSEKELEKIIEGEKTLFKQLKSNNHVIINIDDNSHIRQLEDLETTAVTYGFNSKSTITTSSIDDNSNRLLVCQQRTIKNMHGKKIIPGEFEINIKNYEQQNIYNALASVAAAQVLGVKSTLFNKTFF